MTAYYNEIDKHAAAWLRNLIAAGHIAPGEVDERSIVDVKPGDLRGFAQCHFFAGIGGWSYALRLAGIPDDRPIWTGSAPCQPFSVAGSQRGCADERHLWPAFFNLIRECRPAAVVGEQVAGAAGLAWLDHVHADLEDAGYAVAAANLCAAGVGAPHIRQRLYWVADSDKQRCDGQHPLLQSGRQDKKSLEVAWGGAIGIVGDPSSERLAQRKGITGIPVPADKPSEGETVERTSLHLDAWEDVEWIECSDGKARPAKPGITPLAAGLPKGMVRGGDHGAPIDADDTAEARVMRLRGYGNAIVPQVAAAFVMAALNP